VCGAVHRLAHVKLREVPAERGLEVGDQVPLAVGDVVVDEEGQSLSVIAYTSRGRDERNRAHVRRARHFLEPKSDRQ